MSTKQESKTTVSHLPEHGPIDENGREILLQVKNVDITFGKGDDAVKAVKNASFDIYKGETFSLVGESGSGKTTIGRAVIRVNPCSAGEILYKGVKISGKIPHSLDREVIRNIQMVFQDPAASLNERATVDYIVSEGLYNFHLYENEADRVKKVENMINEVGLLPEHLTRYPHEFSGGQRQRVALARAVVKRSDYFLLDEPLSNLDAQLRLRARKELVKIHEMYRPTMVYVTHDQIEAMTVGQRVAIMYRGNMEMLDTPSHVYNMPASIFCARFIGSPSMNIISCQYENGNLSIGDQMIRLAPMWRPIADACPSGKYCVGIRPEHIVLSSRPTETSICGTVKYVEDYGNRYGVYIDVKGEKSELIAICNDSVPRPGENIFMNIDFRKLHLFDAQSEKSLGYPEEIRRLNAALDFSMPDAQNKNQKTGGKYHESFGQYQCV